ncbi:uncharacterized protein LOC110006362 isoform X1 [Amborella trichopoda]|uniref:uncharacterized protein LOC110006362 isoform X1 n=1 Tax=Amborella trichopoda TaxID=13333 RepID=UPI0009BD6F7B|nr:uncharacterized protein LOC110006362 isoform X1 [Amborella trichopoda]|eukprot:XP_020524156.1 uncharacterized protein LOC110006362 isoform X1 [Amborella trichopoda]
MRLKKRKNNDTHEIDVPSYAPSSSEGHIPETPTSINEEVIDEEEQVGEHFHEKVATSMTRRSAKEAMEGDDSIYWKNAMKDEMLALRKNKTWDLIELPKTRYRARLVPKGFAQKESVDFLEIFRTSCQVRLHQVGAWDCCIS